MSVVSDLSRILREIATAASAGSAYPSWNDAFARKECREVWEDLPASLRKQNGRRFTVEELKTLSAEEAGILGFRSWDGTVRLIPLWAWNYIADGEELICINGKKYVKGTDDIDLDYRAGCLAYGF